MSFNLRSSQIAISIWMLLGLLMISVYSQGPFCSSVCAGYTSACYGPAENQCYACSATIFQLNSGIGTGCILKSQHQVVFHELKNSAMDISSYSTNKPTTQTCSIYTVSGQYIAGDYIQKTFSGIPLNHYQLIVRFGVGYIGTWSYADTMQIKIESSTYTWQYGSCSDAQALCSSSSADCIKIKEYVISHDTSTLALNFTSLISEVDPNVQYWGIKDLVIGIRLCHARCETCFGPNYSDCASCSAGFYLLGNLCVPQCQYYAIEDKRICIQECPAGYFDNGQKLCKSCMQDCLLCNNLLNCEVWSDEKPGAVWEKDKPFWIFLIVVGFLIFLFLLWRLVIRKHLRAKIEAQNEINKRMMSQNSINHESSDKKKTSSSDSDKSQNSKQQKKNQNKDVVVFQQQGLEWVQQIPTTEQIATIMPQSLKRRKKKIRPIEIQQKNKKNEHESVFEMNATFENLKL